MKVILDIMFSGQMIDSCKAVVTDQQDSTSHLAVDVTDLFIFMMSKCIQLIAADQLSKKDPPDHENHS